MALVQLWKMVLVIYYHHPVRQPGTLSAASVGTVSCPLAAAVTMIATLEETVVRI